MTAPYSPPTATAVTVGATDAGYVAGTGPTWDDAVSRYNSRVVELRHDELAVQSREDAHPLEAGYVHMARVWADVIAGWVA